MAAVRLSLRNAAHQLHMIQFKASLSTASTPSSLTAAAEQIRDPLLAACSHMSHESNSFKSQAWPRVLSDWAAVQRQAETLAAWPGHPLTPVERWSLASAFASSAAVTLGVTPDACGDAHCAFYEALLSPGSLFSPRAEGVAHSSVVAVFEENALQVASCEVAALLLSGHAVTIVAPEGPTLEAAKSMVQDFPPELLQADQIGPLVTLPTTVRTLRTIGVHPRHQWVDRAPPGDFGGKHWSNTGLSAHGMARAASPLTMARLNKLELSSSSNWRYKNCENEVAELLNMLPASSGAAGMAEIHNFLDLLWALQEPRITDTTNRGQISIALAPAHKHLLLTFGGAHVPEDIVMAAIISAMSPFNEKITLHTVGLGLKALTQGAFHSFCRLIQSGRAGLHWEVTEHRDWACFLDWLQQRTEADVAQPISLFSLLRNLESEVKRRCAQTGGVAWVQLRTPDLLEQLRRWTEVHEIARCSGPNPV